MHRYSKDTRSLQPGEYYVAIKGERYDGHHFVEEAVRRGAAGIVIEQEIDLKDITNNVEIIKVSNSEQYLAEQAYLKLKRIQPDVIGITGSIGKTSTRNAIVTVLNQTFSTLSPVGNLNTLLGLSLTVLNADFNQDTKLVLEMGASHKGDIAELCTYFPPNVAVVTNIQGVHLSSFGTIETIAQTKGELVHALEEDGIACLNFDDPLVRQMEQMNKGKTIFYGTDERSNYTPDVINSELPMLGDHAIYTALAAYCTGAAFGMSDALINKGLSELKPEKGRLFKLRGRNGSTLIDDSYNASPEATLAALAALRQQAGSRYVVFLGDMLELGEREVQEHARIIRAAANCADVVILVGDLMAAAASTLPKNIRDGLILRKTSVETAEEISSNQMYTPAPGDVVLVKGSQGIRMERISKVLLHPDISPADVLPRQSESWLAI